MLFIFKQDTSHPINVWSVFDDFLVYVHMFPYKEKIAKFNHFQSTKLITLIEPKDR